MKSSSFRSVGRSIIHGTAFGLSAAITVIIVSLVYAATTYYPTDLSNVGSGSGLTSTSWNALVNYANKAVKQEADILSITGTTQTNGKVGIGTAIPASKLSINGDTRISDGVAIKKIKAYTVAVGTNLWPQVWCPTTPGDTYTILSADYFNGTYGWYPLLSMGLLSYAYQHPANACVYINNGNHALDNLTVRVVILEYTP